MKSDATVDVHGQSAGVQRQTGAMGVEAFCDRDDIGRTLAYAEIAAGRLRARKVGRRTIILDDDADAWAQGLPVSAPTAD